MENRESILAEMAGRGATLNEIGECLGITDLLTYSAIAIAAIIIILVLAAIGAAWGQPTPDEREDGGCK